MSVLTDVESGDVPGTEQPPVWSYDDRAVITQRNLTLFNQGVQAAAPFIQQGDVGAAREALNRAIPDTSGTPDPQTKSISQQLQDKWAQDTPPASNGGFVGLGDQPAPAPAAGGLSPDGQSFEGRAIRTVTPDEAIAPPQTMGPISSDDFKANAAAAVARVHGGGGGFLSDLKNGVAAVLSGLTSNGMSPQGQNDASAPSPSNPSDPYSTVGIDASNAQSRATVGGQSLDYKDDPVANLFTKSVLGNGAGQMPGYLDAIGKIPYVGGLAEGAIQGATTPAGLASLWLGGAANPAFEGIPDALGGGVLGNVGRGAIEGSTFNAGLTGLQQAGTGQFDPKQLGESALFGAALGAAVPLAGAGIKALPEAARAATDALGGEGALAGERGSIKLPGGTPDEPLPFEDQTPAALNAAAMPGGASDTALPATPPGGAQAALLRAKVTALGGRILAPNEPNSLNMPGDELAGFMQPQEALSHGQQASNYLRAKFNQPNHYNSVVTPIMEDMRQNASTLQSQAVAMAEEAKQTWRMFKHDASGRVILQDGSKVFLPDLAQEFGQDATTLLDKITPAQANALARDMSNHEAFRSTAAAAGIDIGEVDGYLPRGTPTSAVDTPRLAVPGTGKTGGKVGPEKARVYDTMEQGVANGETYPSYTDAVAKSAGSLANRIAAAHASELLKPLGTTAGDRIDPVLRNQVQGLRDTVSSLDGKLSTAESRAGIATGKGAELNAPLAKMSDIAPSADAKAQLADSINVLNQARRTALQAARAAGGSTVIDRQSQAAFNAALTNTAADLASRSIVPADQIQRMLVQHLEGTPVEGASNQAANAYLLRGASEISAKNAASNLAGATSSALADAKDLAPDDVYTAIRQMQRRADVLSARGTQWSGLADSIQQQLTAARGQLEDIKPSWQEAQARAAATPRGYSQIGLAPLSGHAFPNEIANAANAALATPDNLAGKILTTVGNGLNTTRTLLDFATPMRLIAADVMHPGAALDALGTSIKSVFGHPDALGEAIASQNALAASDATHTSVPAMIKDYGLKLSASQPSAEGLRGLINKIPVIGNVVLTPGSRFINTYLDAFRISALDDSIQRYGAAGLIDTPGSRQALGNVINIATGEGKPLFGAHGYGLVNFPKWLGSQFEFISKALTSGTIEGAYARESLLKLMGGAIGLTYAVNTAQGKPTVWRDGVPNMSVGDTNIQPFGPWGTLIRAAGKLSPVALDSEHNLQRPDLAYIVKSKGAPGIQILADAITGTSFTGITPSVTNPNYLIRSMLPYTLANAGIPGASGALAPKESLSTWALNAIGARATDMTATQNLDAIATQQGYPTFFGAPPSVQSQIKGANPEAWSSWVAQASTASQQADAAKSQFIANEQGRDDTFTSGKMSVQDWYNTQLNDRNNLAGQEAQIYANSSHGAPKTASDRYYAEINANTTNNVPDWTKIRDWLTQQSPEDQQYIDQNTGLLQTPLTQLRKDLAKQLYAIPKYVGYTGDQASAIDALVQDAKNHVVATLRGDTASELRGLSSAQSANPGKYDAATVAGARRAILGLLVDTGQRTRWTTAHPESALLYGKGIPGPATLAAINAALAKQKKP